MQAATIQNNNYGGLSTATKKNTKDSQSKIIDFSQWRKYAEEQVQSSTMPSTTVDIQESIQEDVLKAPNGKVNALRTEEQIQEVKDYFLNHTNERTQNKWNEQGLRNYCIFVFGINTALRASDILSFRIGQVVNSDGSIKDKYTIREKKTGKKRDVYFNDSIKEAITKYLSTRENYQMSDYLFPGSKLTDGKQKALTVNALSKIMDKCGKDLEFDKKYQLSLGSHTMRKTFCRIMLQRYKDNSLMIISISEELNHSNLKTTYTYADITADEKREMFMNNCL